MWRNDEDVTQIRAAYPVGTRIKLVKMNDPLHPVEPGTTGTVALIDGIGQLHMKWDNGRTLAVIPGVDEFEVVR